MVVFSEAGDNIEYIHSGYEYIPGDLSDDLAKLKSGADPASEWDGNDIENTSGMTDPNNFESWFPTYEEGLGWDIVADNDGIYPEKMGSSAKKELF